MRDSTKSNLSDFAVRGTAVAVAGLAIYALESTGFPKYVQELGLAHAKVTGEYLGSFLGDIRTTGAYVARGLFDGLAGLFTGLSAGAAVDYFLNKRRKK